ncbi:MAG: molecular chaperone HtpG [Alphaproteobacteria bacterium]|nr:molecular chaperone HtpG [Alphaproteobacteria bacterium]
MATKTTERGAAADGGIESYDFQAEVSKLLDIVAHSLYSEKGIFLRELISNASDACDKLRYAALTKPALTADDPDLRVELSLDKKANTLTLADNGIGMNRKELIENLGTIARSGTAAFVERLSKAGTEGADDVSLIGQFGVGFYSTFMVAEKVEVLTRKAGEKKAWLWGSDGKGAFTIAPAERDSRGTSVIVHLAKAEKDYLDPGRIRNIVKTYSDHIQIPIILKDGDADDRLNEASALWTRPKSQIKPEQYAEFYRHVSHGLDEPWHNLHWKAEGKIEYTGLLFIPSQKPFDLFDPQRRHGVKLYVKRVFITDECEGLVPGWLRFLKGIVDSEDLPLNVSREMLQDNPLVAKIRAGLVTRVLNELKKRAEKAPDDYAAFWNNFGAVVKEGLYEDSGQRDKLLEIVRFRSNSRDGLVSLADYVERMKPGQEHIYYITGDDVDSLKQSPQLEGFTARDVEVLLLSDPIDEFWVPAAGTFQDKAFKSVTRGGADLANIEGAKAPAEEKSDETPTEGVETLIAAIKLALKDAVKDVRASERLTDSAVCLVADEGGLDMNLERMLRQHGRIDEISARILELNPKHPLIRKLTERAQADGGVDAIEDAAWLLLDQARILEGEALPDPAAFARRMSAIMTSGIG